jgi:hypothetical protein
MLTHYYSPIEFQKISDISIIDCYNDINRNVDYYQNSIENKTSLIIFCIHQYWAYKVISNIILPLIRCPFVIVSAMEDTVFPNEIEGIENVYESPFFRHAFVINKVIPNCNKFTSIPYGLNYWTLQKCNYFGEPIMSSFEQDHIIRTIASSAKPFYERISKIYANFHHNCTDGRYGDWRRQLPGIIPPETIHYAPNVVSRRESYTQNIEYAFVISPFGHGYDCIRTFEALCLGCIVIMRKSFLDCIYEGLPVLLVDEWTDIDQTLLQETIETFSKKTFAYEKLTMEYWVNLVKNKLL